LKALKLICSVLAVLWLAGCHDDASGVTTVPASAVGNVHATVGMATLSWVAPTTDTNGDALNNLGGYRIYYGLGASDLRQTVNIANVGTQTYVINNLGSGTWYFAVKALTNTGVESALSQVVSKTIT
jgi:hypothetical protein